MSSKRPKYLRCSFRCPYAVEGNQSLHKCSSSKQSARIVQVHAFVACGTRGTSVGVGGGGVPRQGRRNSGWRSSLHARIVAHVESSHLDIIVEICPSVRSQEAAEVLQSRTPAVVVIIIRAGTREVETICIFVIVVESSRVGCWLCIAL